MKDLWISASQLDTHALCRRKWWFLKVKKVPLLPQAHFAFGTCLHAVCERYLGADDLGRGPDGKPVVLYPDGWHMDERGFALTNVDQVLIRTLVDKGIEEGVLVRQPDAVVEKKIERRMTPKLMFVGYVDYCCPDGIEDHKTTKSSRWLLSAKKLSRNTQILLYAYDWLQAKIEAGGSVPPNIRLQHNGFIKDPDAPQVRKTTVFVSPAEAEDEWARAIEQGKQMIRDAQVTDPLAFEDPEPGACMKYNGCEMRSVCGGRETLEKYCARVARITQERYSPETSESKSKPNNKSSMGLRDRIQKRGASSATVNSPAPKAAAPKAASKKPAAAAAAPAGDPWGDTPPWAVEGCKICSGKHPGFNSKGGICRACKNKTEVDVNEFDLSANGDGSITWTDGDVEGTTRVAAPAKAKVTVVEPEPPTAPVTPETAPDEPEEQPEEPDEPEVQEKAPAKSTRRGPGRPPAGPKILIGVMPIKGIRQERIQHAADVLHRFGEELAKEAGVASYYAMVAYERRSQIAQVASTIAADIGSDYLLVSNPENPDIESMVSALIPFAEQVLSR